MRKSNYLSIFVIPAKRLCHDVFARESHDRSNLVSCRIHEITTTPERRLIMTNVNCGNGRLKTFSKNFIIYLLCFYLVFQPVIAQAGSLMIPGFNSAVTSAPANTVLPVLKNPGVRPTGVSGFDTSTANKLVIHQSQPQTIIDWSSFDIGADAWVKFDQQGNTSWVALNRIYSQSPSLIFGKLTADGKIYLINQNGILFGPGSQINVYSLVASALNIRNDDFIKQSLKFYLETGTTADDVDLSGNPYSYSGITYSTNAAVSNFGKIVAATGGSVFLIGPNVENYGSIDAPVGQIGLAAGTLVDLIAPYVNPEATGYQRTAFIVDV